MTHAAKGQHGMDRFEFHRMKMPYWQWHALKRPSRSWGQLREAECEEAKAQVRAQPSPTLHWDGGGTGATGRGCAGLWLQHTSASLRTEAHWTRKSSEAAHGVFSRVIEKKRFFLPASGSSEHWHWSAKYTWGDKHVHTYVRTRTHLLHVHSPLVRDRDL